MTTSDKLASAFASPDVATPFVGRHEEMAELQGWFSGSGAVPMLLTGMGGIGKTALAAKFAELTRLAGSSVFWVSPTWEAGLASALGWSAGKTDERGLVEALRASLASSGALLLVVDDALDVGRIQEILPTTGRTHTLITSRDASFGKLGHALALGPLTERASVDLLVQMTPELTPSDAATIARTTGGHPLALTMAAQAARRAGVEPLLESLGWVSEPRGSERSARDLREREYVRLARRDYDEGLDLIKTGLYEQAVARLMRATQVLTERLGPAHSDALTARTMLAEALRASGRYLEAIDLLKQVIALRQEAGLGEDVAMLVSKAALAASFREIGDLNKAWGLLEEVSTGLDQALGENHPDAIEAKSNLATLCFEMGMSDKSMGIMADVVESATTNLGQDNRLTISAKETLASMLAQVGRTEQARELREVVLEARRRTLGPDHPDTITAMANMAATLYDLGDINQAEALVGAVVEARRRVLGPDHPDTLTALANLGATCHALGRYSEALDIEERVLQTRLRVLGREHPDTLTAMNNLAATLSNMGDMERARMIAEEVLATQMRVLGPEHPDTLTAMNNLAATLYSRGEDEKARELGRLVLEGRRRILGPDHPDTMAAATNLGAPSRAQRGPERGS